LLAPNQPSEQKWLLAFYGLTVLFNKEARLSCWINLHERNMVIAATTRSCTFKWENQLKNLTLKIMLVTIGTFAALPISAYARNCQATGNTVFCDDGVTYQRSGNTTFGSDGSTSQRIGNTTFHSDGSTSQQIGNTRFDSDGSTSQRIGNTIHNSNGSNCQIIGNQMFCN